MDQTTRVNYVFRISNLCLTFAGKRYVQTLQIITMKTRFLTIALMMAAVILSAKAQTLTFRICYDETETVRGELYQYSERYLGTNLALTESGTTYTLRSVEVQEPDTAGKSHSQGKSHKDRPEQGKKKNVAPHLPALSEDALLASGTAKKAEIVAKQIYRIRDARMAILSGESEHAPADGKAMELTLKELNRQEEELTALFLGTTYSTPHTQTIEYTLNDSIGNEVNDIMLRFSQFTGPVAADDLSGEPVHIVRYNQLAERPSTQKKAKKGEKEIYITNSRIAIFYADKQLTEYKLPKDKPTAKKKK